MNIWTRIRNYFKPAPLTPPPPPPGLNNFKHAQELIDHRVANPEPNGCAVTEVNMPKGLTCPPVGWGSWFYSSDPHFPLVWGTVVGAFPNYINIITPDGRGMALYAKTLTNVSRETPEHLKA